MTRVLHENGPMVVGSCSNEMGMNVREAGDWGVTLEWNCGGWEVAEQGRACMYGRRVRTVLQ